MHKFVWADSGVNIKYIDPLNLVDSIHADSEAALIRLPHANKNFFLATNQPRIG